MRIAYFDCFSGASGNMILGALVDAGLSLDALTRELRKLPVSGWRIEAQPVRKRGLGALYLDVHVPGEDHDRHDHRGAARSTVKVDRPIGDQAARSTVKVEGSIGDRSDDRRHAGVERETHAHRTLADVLGVLRAAGLPSDVQKTASAIYHRLGEAEARVHREPLERIAFHEVGQIDAIVDVAGAALGLYLLGVERVYCSPLPCGRGFVDAGHGKLPSPAPATMDMLRGVPTYDVDIDAELVTPTGAAILTTVASFEQRPPMIVDSVGYGAGRSDFPFANVLRVLVGESVDAERASSAPDGSVTVLETNIDDMNPQLYEHVMERLFAAGALDAWTHPIQMKKGRPGVMLCALAAHERADAVATTMLAETTTIGVRRYTATRDALPREEITVDTEFGPVRVKVVRAPTGVRARPEFEDCRAIARRDGLTLGEVIHRVEAGVDAWLASRSR